ncbi:MAG: DUF4465 domain-containing protein [Deltaproteobacteria bacterium]|nr:DUF4465 domain-containing protein [Deltaproteobacteria bacterium]
MKKPMILALAFLLATPALALRAPQPADFEDVGAVLSPETFWNGADGSGSYTSGDWNFANIYNATWGSWEGFAYSNVTDTTTKDYSNQYAAITGGGVRGSATYGVAYQGMAGPPVATNTTGAAPISGLYVTNTAYAYWTMKEGNAFAKKFGGADGTDPDWFLLTITGRDAQGAVTGTTEVYLADFRFSDNTKDYILDKWKWVDLAAFGSTATLEFSLSSSDNGDWGMNTPAYFALDSLNGVPLEVGADSDDSSGCFVGAAGQGSLLTTLLNRLFD